MINEVRIIPITGIPDIFDGDKLPNIIIAALETQHVLLENKDVLVITQKIVSKAEGRVIDLNTVEPSTFAKQISKTSKKDPRYIEIVLRETKRIVRMDHGVLITETHHGFICANAGVDESNVDGKHSVSLLPIDPDISAQKLREALKKNAKGFPEIGIIISDTWGRPWREGQINVAIGISGLNPLADYRGISDTYGYQMKASVIAVADELAGAAELAMGKIEKVPATLIRGYNYVSGNKSAKLLLRNPRTDMFR